MASMKKLGKTQAAWLHAIASHGGVWHPGSGFLWDTRSHSIRLCESLAKRGLLVLDPDRRCQPCYRIPKP